MSIIYIKFKVKFPKLCTNKEIHFSPKTCFRIHQSRPKKVLSEPCFSSNFIYDGASKRAYSPVSSIKSNVQEKKSPFLSYGWNDSNKDIGSKRTFNINASSEEVRVL